jgi:hypothetical protein
MLVLSDPNSTNGNCTVADFKSLEIGSLLHVRYDNNRADTQAKFFYLSFGVFTLSERSSLGQVFIYLPIWVTDHYLITSKDYSHSLRVELEGL